MNLGMYADDAAILLMKNMPKPDNEKAGVPPSAPDKVKRLLVKKVASELKRQLHT